MHYPSHTQMPDARPHGCDEMSGTRPPKTAAQGFATAEFRDAVNKTCAEIFKRWCRFLPEHEAREQADQFRERCESLAAEGYLTDGELGATLAIVAASAEETPR